MSELDLTSFRKQIGDGACLFFLHIPKTAGSTFVEFFKKNHKGISNFWYTEEQRFAFLNELLSEENSKFRISGGHFTLEEASKKVKDGTLFLSFVRHPVDRLVSYYNFSKVTHTENLTSSAARGMDLKNFLLFLEKKRPRILKNQQCRFLSGLKSLDDQLDISFADVQQSWEGKKVLILPLDLCSEVIRLLSIALDGKEVVEITHAKVSKVDETKAIDRECLGIILRNNEADLELFNAHCHVADKVGFR